MDSHCFPLPSNSTFRSNLRIGFVVSAQPTLRLLARLLVCLCFVDSARALTLLTYNVAGNGAADWSTNAPQVQAIGRQMQYLQPDVITFNEIPFRLSYEMTNFVSAFLPGYHLARDSGTDGFIRSVIVSRFPIARSQKWLDGVELDEFGVDARFARDLYEAEINVPDFQEPLHVFTTHLKALSDSTSAARRGAEASAISNFFVTVFLPAYGHRPYVLTGDLNEDVDKPPSSSQQPFARILNGATGLRLATPTNSFSGSERTYSSRASLTARFDYILPGGLLYSNILGGQVFSTDVLAPLPGDLERTDSETASDHLPVLIEFRNPYDEPIRLQTMTLSDQQIAIFWQSRVGRRYRVDGTDDFSRWATVVPVLLAEESTVSWRFPLEQRAGFFRVRELSSLP